MRPGYRIRQFWQALTAVPSAEVPPELSPGLRELFLGMSPADRSHALRTYQRLLASGQISRDLAIAALLHDVGKSLAPIHLWDRVCFVLAARLAPAWLRRLAAGTGSIRWPGLIALQNHAEQGARWVEAAGGVPQVVALIRYHHSPPDSLPWSPGERALLAALQRADEAS